jgi:hypothetical protein
LEQFNKIDIVKSGISASEKARQLLGVDDVSLKLDKPFRTLGIDSNNLDRERMVALSLIGVQPFPTHLPLLVSGSFTGIEEGDPSMLCTCSSAGRTIV